MNAKEKITTLRDFQIAACIGGLSSASVVFNAKLLVFVANFTMVICMGSSGWLEVRVADPCPDWGEEKVGNKIEWNQNDKMDAKGKRQLGEIQLATAYVVYHIFLLQRLRQRLWLKINFPKPFPNFRVCSGP